MVEDDTAKGRVVSGSRLYISLCDDKKQDEGVELCGHS